MIVCDFYRQQIHDPRGRRVVSKLKAEQALEKWAELNSREQSTVVPPSHLLTPRATNRSFRSNFLFTCLDMFCSAAPLQIHSGECLPKKKESIRLKYDVNHDRKSFPRFFGFRFGMRGMIKSLSRATLQKLHQSEIKPHSRTIPAHGLMLREDWRWKNDAKCIKMALFSLSIRRCRREHVKAALGGVRWRERFTAIDDMTLGEANNEKTYKTMLYCESLQKTVCSVGFCWVLFIAKLFAKINVWKKDLLSISHSHFVAFASFHSTGVTKSLFVLPLNVTWRCLPLRMI
jgi:hypothetical protein